MTETKQEAIIRIGNLLDECVTRPSGKDVGGTGRFTFTQGPNVYDPAAEERAKIVAWLRSQGGHNDDIYEEAANDIESGAHHGASK
jgi:hypothetical protein